MARPREFETEDALDRGMHLLWTRGYESTSLDDLLASMGISKSSFYDTFGTKHDFLMAALTRYIDVVLGRLAEDLKHGSAREAIARSFEAMLPARGESVRGCFVQNCAIEMAQRDPEARAKVVEGLQRLEDGYYRAVVRGQEHSEFDRTRDGRTTARFLVNSLNGLQVLARAGAGRRILQQIADFTMSAIA